MPELPEARTIARRLHQAVAGSTVSAVSLRRPDMLKTGSTQALGKLIGQTCHTVDTRGKYVVMHFPLARLVIQLGMAGRLRISPQTDPLEPHTHLILSLADSRHIRYSNVRRIASGLHLLPPGREDLGLLALLGKEATDITPNEFIDALAPSRQPIKGALLNQSRIAGVGNIYSDEALFRARIHPARRADSIPRRDIRRLHAAVRQVLAEAIAAGGSSLADANPFLDADGQVGNFAPLHQVYGRCGLPCLKCRHQLESIIIAGRRATFCPRCQR